MFKKIISGSLVLALVVSLVPAQAAAKDTPASYKGYKLVWQDEFDGTKLNTKDWNVEAHEPGWVNAELQEYPDKNHSSENIYLEDGHLVIKPVAKKKDTASQDYPAAGNVYDDYTFTSGRINTENKHNFTYGMFETRAKVPSGAGYLPAFWLMAANENAQDEYGVWPTCGEIDMMEVLGSDTKTLHGTIHYGNPHKQNQGTYELAEGDFASEYHTYRTEWLPGKIAWYVDDIKYYETSDWYSARDDGKTLTYPAPFDHDMYVILNLAVGGNWVGYPDEAAIDDMVNQEYDIDYVRVYQKDSYDENVQPPEAESVDLRTPDANGEYIINSDFSKSLEEDGSWEFMTQQGGEASATVSDNTLTVNTAAEGEVDYSIQLVQANLPMEKGKKYKLQFDALSSGARQMQVAVNAPDRGWIQYMPAKIIDLDTEKKTFDFVFDMTDASDPNGRLDFNMGHFGSTEDIRISNVSLKQVGDAVTAETKKAKRSDGNYVYNGGFEEGINRLGYWEITKDKNSKVSVTNTNKNGKRVRRLKIVASKKVTAKKPLVIAQPDLALEGGKSYQLSYELKGAKKSTVTITVAGKSTKTKLKNSKLKKYGPTKLKLAKKPKNTTIQIKITEPGTYYFDNISLED